jgi:pimeloyl-ACP methyl ester carboxylesterase
MVQFEKGGQIAWFHDEGHSAGFFHTYDRLQVGGDGDAPRKIHVFLPREYETVVDEYPVIYMNDGDTAFFRGGAIGQSWWTGETLGELYKRNAIARVIVVAIYALNRDREYTHEPAVPRWIRQVDCCGVEAYTQYLADALKPFIDRSYRTIPDPRQTTIMGSSHGGLAAFYTACRRPDAFGNAAALSPSFWVGLDTGTDTFLPLHKSSLLELTAPTLGDRDRRPRLWLDWGLRKDEGFHNWFIENNTVKRGREMAELLREQFGYVLGRDLWTYEDPEGEHSEESWARRLPLVLQALYGNGDRP